MSSTMALPVGTESPRAAEKLEKPEPIPQSGGAKNYKGFVAGVFSGIAKLSGA